MITLTDYKRDPQTGEDRAVLYPNDWTPEVEANAIKLLDIVNKLLDELNIKEAKVSSGFRPPAINGKITTAAKKSFHQIGLAVDILDNKNQDLCKLIASRPELLKKYNLWMEDPAATKGHSTNWCHLDLGVRSDRPVRIFKV